MKILNVWGFSFTFSFTVNSEVNTDEGEGSFGLI